MKLEHSGQIFGTESNTKYHENHLSGSRDVPCGQMDGKTRTVIVACRNFEYAPKKRVIYPMLSKKLFKDSNRNVRYLGQRRMYTD